MPLHDASDNIETKASFLLVHESYRGIDGRIALLYVVDHFCSKIYQPTGLFQYLGFLLNNEGQFFPEVALDKNYFRTSCVKREIPVQRCEKSLSPVGVSLNI